MANRIYNFSPGPGALPLPVLEEVQKDLLDFGGMGMSILEMSHRSKTVESVLDATASDLRELADVPENYRVLFLQGGASLQFSMIPMNLVSSHGSVDYIVTGHFAKLAAKEAEKIANINIAATTEAEGFRRIPRPEDIKLDKEAAYVHITTNNTISGTQWTTEPEVGNVPLVADASSDIFSRPIDVTRYGLVYAGAQKNLGAAGVTLVIIRDDLLERIPDGLPTMLDYRTYVTTKSLHNTPPVFAIYVVRLVVKWLLEQGRLGEIGRRNREKAELLYSAIDSSEFYHGYAEPDSRSLMNVTLRLPTEQLGQEFVSQASKEGLDGLRGHRSVGGLRASIYNAFPREGVEALVSFMREFERLHG